MPLGAKTDNNEGIYEWELLAPLLGLRIVINYTRSTPVSLFVYNQSAVDSLISGSCKSALSTQICAAFWAFAASDGVNVWGGICALQIK